MVSNLTVGKNEYEGVQDLVKKLAEQGQVLKDELLRAIDLDTLAFNRVMDGFRLPKKTEEQERERAEAIESANKEATRIPLGILEKCVTALKLAKDIAHNGNKNSLSDAGVAALTAQAGAEGAYYNVLINLPNIQDRSFTQEMESAASSLKAEAAALGDEMRILLEKELKEKLP